MIVELDAKGIIASDHWEGINILFYLEKMVIQFYLKECCVAFEGMEVLND